MAAVIQRYTREPLEIYGLARPAVRPAVRLAGGLCVVYMGAMRDTSDVSPKTAAVVAIGDELLNGRTRDSNIHHLAGWLTERGVVLREARMILDDRKVIMETVNALRRDHDYVFTTGGIGPTHDDITAGAIGAAFGVKVGIRADALAILEEAYGSRGEKVTPARARMARIPDGARLIDNPLSRAPGFQIGNVFVLAGVPSVMRAMLADVGQHIIHGPAPLAMTVRGQIAESEIADGLEAVEKAYRGLSIGSYPGRSERGFGTAVVIRSLDKKAVHEAALAVEQLMKSLGIEGEIVEGAAVFE